MNNYNKKITKKTEKPSKIKKRIANMKLDLPIQHTRITSFISNRQLRLNNVSQVQTPIVGEREKLDEQSHETKCRNVLRRNIGRKL